MLARAKFPEDGFEQFWEIYPRRIGKKTAMKCFEAIRKRNEVPFEVLLSAAKNYARSRLGKEMQYTKHPTTWLNGGCWDDDPNAWLNIRIGSSCEMRIPPAPLREEPVQKPTETDLDQQFRRLGLQHLRVTGKYRLEPGQCSYCDRHKPGEMMPSHTASAGCQSGKRAHCTCDACF